MNWSNLIPCIKNKIMEILIICSEQLNHKYPYYAFKWTYSLNRIIHLGLFIDFSVSRKYLIFIFYLKWNLPSLFFFPINFHFHINVEFIKRLFIAIQWPHTFTGSFNNDLFISYWRCPSAFRDFASCPQFCFWQFL